MLFVSENWLCYYSEINSQPIYILNTTIYMVINMVKMKEKKRGPKYPPGVAKRKILLIALTHPDEIGEEKLISEIIEKLSFSKKGGRGIKGHLDDLGPGRTVRKKWIKGKHYLIKIPSKFEPKDTKTKLMKVLKTQEIEIDILDLPEENVWKPNLDREIFDDIWSNELQNREEVLSFLNSQYTQRMISNEYMDGYKGLNLEEENSETFFGGDCVESFFEEGMKLSPTFLHYTIHAGLPEVEVAANILHSTLKECPDGSTIRIYRGGGPKKYDITRQIEDSAELLYVSLLIDSKKYPELRSKIIDFFKGPAFGPQYFNLPFPDLYMI